MNQKIIKKAAKRIKIFKFGSITVNDIFEQYEQSLEDIQHTKFLLEKTKKDYEELKEKSNKDGDLVKKKWFDIFTNEFKKLISKANLSIKKINVVSDMYTFNLDDNSKVNVFLGIGLFNAVHKTLGDVGINIFTPDNKVVEFDLQLNSKPEDGIKKIEEYFIGKQGNKKFDKDDLPLKSYIRSRQGEGYIVAQLPTGQYVINIRKNAKEGRRVSQDEISAIWNESEKKWNVF